MLAQHNFMIFPSSAWDMTYTRTQFQKAWYSVSMRLRDEMRYLAESNDIKSDSFEVYGNLLEGLLVRLRVGLFERTVQETKTGRKDLRGTIVWPRWLSFLNRFQFTAVVNTEATFVTETKIYVPSFGNQNQTLEFACGLTGKENITSEQIELMNKAFDLIWQMRNRDPDCAFLAYELERVRPAKFNR